MSPHQISKIKSKIDALSTDEDVRQSLWLAILESPNMEIDLDIALEQILSNQKIDSELTLKMSKTMIYPPDEKTTELLSLFSPLEQSIMALLMLGLDIYTISRYKSLRIMWLQQMISNIALHPVWESSLGKEIKIRRKIWID